GFGKTEVALRAAFVAAMSGHQVALVAPTTLLARQHLATFEARFRGFPVRIAQLSRLVSAAEARKVREGLGKGTIDIVIGTHALLGSEVSFARLGLVIVDEEQHFGVRHKERLKRLRHEVHVLTLSATPIPRTLQLALAGVRDLTLIATPPVDRLAVRSFVTPFDPLVVREALLREHARGGQSFYVAPRIADLAEIERFLAEQLPELRFHVAHGRMKPSEIEARMSDFYEGRIDVLLSTSIIESGLDIPRANTLIVHRADLFGLAQLYQIRGRIGRSKQRGYAYFTLPARRTITEGARRRLEVLASLDTLGAGFQLASHDLDIRGAGNLLGEEQSGHIREVGIELYQQMLEEAVAELRSGGAADEETERSEDWSPQINVGAAVLIPEDYVADLDLRMSLYRRLARLASGEEIAAFAEELADRFGPPPSEVKQLLKVVETKLAARTAGIERLDVGEKGLILSFRNGTFANPQGLIAWLAGGRANARLRPDHKLVIHARSRGAEDRLRLALHYARALARLAVEGEG
ncbi:MAG: DEAD/DEAH box helicase, partial [Alphaproteobacteria bacterium]